MAFCLDLFRVKMSCMTWQYSSVISNLLIVYSFKFCTFCKRLHIRILRNDNIPQASSWPQDNHKCLAIFVLLIWHDGKMVRKRA